MFSFVRFCADEYKYIFRNLLRKMKKCRNYFLYSISSASSKISFHDGSERVVCIRGTVRNKPIENAG